MFVSNVVIWIVHSAPGRFYQHAKNLTGYLNGKLVFIFFPTIQLGILLAQIHEASNSWKNSWGTTLNKLELIYFSSTAKINWFLQIIQRESILQEIILVLADLGKFKEALDELDLYDSSIFNIFRWLRDNELDIFLLSPTKRTQHYIYMLA